MVPFQFSIMALLVLMTLVSILFALHGQFGRVGAAFGVQFVYIVVIGYFLWQFHVGRSAQKEDDDLFDS
jgi:hypothetical protein